MTSKPTDYNRVDPSATVVDPERPISNTALRQRATEVIANEPSGTQPWSNHSVAASPSHAGATQVIHVRHPSIQSAPSIQPAPIVEVTSKRDIAPPRVAQPQPVAPVRHDQKPLGNALLVMSPTQAERFRPNPAPAVEPLPAPAARAPEKQPAYATVLEAPVVRVPVKAAPLSARPSSSVPSLSAIAKVGVLARRYPVGVFGGAAVGALVLGVFLVGAAQILGLGGVSPSVSKSALAAKVTAPKLEARVTAPVATVAVASGTAAPVASASSVVVAPIASVSPAIKLSDVAQQAAAAATEAAVANDPSLSAAVGALFSGRLIEAEQAYRDLAMKHAENAAYRTLSRILARHNSTDCRPGNPSQKACPTVRP